MGNNKLVLFIVVIITYLLSAGISYSIFANGGIGGSPTDDNSSSVPLGKVSNDYEALEFDPNQPKTEECPLTGVKYGKDQKKWWENHRPLGIMIENHQEARPQSGIQAADITYEAVAEGGITRYLNVYYCQDAGIVGPVRSARTYFLDFISEYGPNPLYAHVGGANTPGPANALGQIEDYGWAGYNDLNQFSIGFPTFKRDESRLGHDVATEHTMYSTTSKLWAVGEKRDLTEKDEEGVLWSEDYVPYTFKKNEPEVSSRPAAQSVHVEFWEGFGAYSVDWVYDKASNTYLRKNGGAAHMDRNTNKQLSTKNLVVLSMAESRANDGYEGNVHLLYRTKGKGKATFYIDGKEIKGNWSKDGRIGKTELTDSSGDEVEFSPGKIWFEIVPLDGVVTAK